MKNLIAGLLIKLAEKEEESKELVAQVEALEIVITALLRRMDVQQRQQLSDEIDCALRSAIEHAQVETPDTNLLQQYIQKLLTFSQG